MEVAESAVGSGMSERPVGTSPATYIDVDASPDAALHLERLDDVETFAPHIELREFTYSAIPGGSGVDVGCGHGLAVAELVGRGVEAVGVDRSNIMVEAARKRFPSCTFVAAEAAALPFPNGTLQWYRAERVYQHLQDPLAGLVEARRVLTPGGKVIIADQDFHSTVIASNDPGLTRTIVGAFVDGITHGNAGTLVPGLLAEAGFTHIKTSAVAMTFTDLNRIGPHLPYSAATLAVQAGLVSTQQAGSWLEDLTSRARENQFLLALIMFVSTAVSPETPARS